MRWLTFVGCAGVWVGGVHAQVIFSDDFEGYADQSEMSAPGAWGDAMDPGQLPPDGFFLLEGGAPGRCMGHDGGETNRHAIPPVLAFDSRPVVWEFDVVELAAIAGSSRVTGGLRVGASTAILEMGYYNALDWPEAGGSNTGGYGVRTVFVGGPTDDGGWICFPTNPTLRTGVHHFRATIRSHSITFELDLDDDGVVDDTRVVQTADMSALGWDVLRIGGPSDVTSAAGAFNFDNVSIGVVNLCPADLAEPHGALDFSDVFAFLVAFGNSDAAADLAAPFGVFDFSDVFAFLVAFGAGCP